MSNDVAQRVLETAKTRPVFTFVTGLWIFLGAGLSGAACFLGNPIAGALGMTITFIWDVREFLKRHEKTKDSPERPTAHIYLFLARNTIYFAIMVLTVVFAGQSPGEGTASYDSYLEQFVCGFEDMPASVAKTMAGISGALSFLYGILGMVVWATRNRNSKA